MNHKGKHEVAIIGTGNVGGLLLQYLMPNELIDQIVVINRSKESSEAIYLDTVSAYPTQSNKLRIGTYKDTENSDVIVICAGSVQKRGQSLESLLEENKGIVSSILKNVSIKEDAILVLMSTPVDEITPFAQKITNHAKSKVIGFGGSLDVNRLKYHLIEEMLELTDNKQLYYLGKHGKKGIAYFRRPGIDFDKINDSVRYYATRIRTLVGKSPIYGPAKALSSLVEALLEDTPKVLCVSGYHQEYKLYLTWPFVIGNREIIQPIPVNLSAKEKTLLDALLKSHYYNF